MKSEIFYFSEAQKSNALKLKDLIRERIDPVLLPSLNDIAEHQEASEVGWRYVKLLQASIPPEKGIKLSLSNISLFGYSFYMQVYYPFVFGVRSFQGNSKAAFFPALAIHDRMVLVPKGLAKLLEHEEGARATLNPLEMGGVEEVDFDNDLDVSAALNRVREILRAEVFRDLRVYAARHAVQQPDLSKLAEHFETDAGFLLRVWESMAEERYFYREISCELDKLELQPDRWSKLMLTIHNNSKMQVTNLLVEIAGPVKVLPSRIRVSLEPASAQRVPIALMPEAVGDFPLEFVFVLPEDEPFNEFLPVHHLWLHCE